MANNPHETVRSSVLLSTWQALMIADAHHSLIVLGEGLHEIRSQGNEPGLAPLWTRAVCSHGKTRESGDLGCSRSHFGDQRHADSKINLYN